MAFSEPSRRKAKRKAAGVTDLTRWSILYISIKSEDWYIANTSRADISYA